MNLNLSKERFEIAFEKQYDKYNISERPDWYIREKKTGKILIGRIYGVEDNK